MMEVCLNEDLAFNNLLAQTEPQNGQKSLCSATNMKDYALLEWEETNGSVNTTAEGVDEGPLSKGEPGLSSHKQLSCNGVNRSTSFNDRIKLEDFDRSLSISLEELMENIRVPLTGQDLNFEDAGSPECQFETKFLNDERPTQDTNRPTIINSDHEIDLISFCVNDAESSGEHNHSTSNHDINCNTQHTACCESMSAVPSIENNNPRTMCESCDASEDRYFPGKTGENTDNMTHNGRDGNSVNTDIHIDNRTGDRCDKPQLLQGVGRTSNCDEDITQFSDVSQTTETTTSQTLALALELNQSSNNHTKGSENTVSSCRTPEYCKELWTLTLSEDRNHETDNQSQAAKDPSNDSPELIRLSRPRCAKEIQQEILFSGVVILPGCYDNSCRPVLFITGDDKICGTLGRMEIARFMLYLVSSASYVTLFVDLKTEDAWKFIKDAILLFQWNRPGTISRIIIASEEMEFHIEDDDFNAQCNVVHNRSEILEFIKVDNLPERFGGNLKYVHHVWVKQRLDLESYVLLCEMLLHNFERNRVSMTTAAMPTTLQDTADTLNRHRSTMTELLDDTRVRDLHDTGHRFLTDFKTIERPENQSYAEQIQASYESVCSAIQRYVQVADERLLALERHLLVKQFEESCDQILSWASDRRDELHQKFGEVADSLIELRKQRKEFDKFYLEVVKQYAQCDCLLSEANQLSSSGFLGKVNSQARNAAEKIAQVVQDMEMKKEEVETASQLYLFVDQAYSWALTGMKFVASLSMSDSMAAEEYQEQIEKYDEYMEGHPPIPDDDFVRMRDIAMRYNNIKGQRQCEVAQQKCNETKELFKKRRRLLVKARSHQLAELKKSEAENVTSLPAEEEKMNETSTEDCLITSTEADSEVLKEKNRSLLRQNSDISHRLNRPLVGSNNNNNGGIPTAESPNESAATAVSASSKHRPKKILRKSASMSSHSANQKLKIGLPMRNQEPDTHGRTKWSLAIEELILTEEEYVRSLNYIIEHYFPLMNQLDDVPQALRGKRGVIFGNIENIRDFHAGQFLEALQGCEDDPGQVAEVFIQHRDSFGMYALYSKNKPRSDDLMREHGTKFFRAKQHSLRDKMDLASYLLKPVQRMGKYSLLLHNIAKHSDIRFRSLLREAESLVKFQLRHGNDLLAMDSIIDCDVNLKEQGELRRQDEFFIFHGRRKYLRHVFLFDDLVLLSKPQRVHGGHDLYHYKSSYKTAEIGLTENIGETGLKFEIWFRKPMQDNVIFHSSSEQKKQAWVEEIRSILWKQALRNKANRRNEMVNMGVGSKPHLDIRLSQSPITDRSVAAEKLMGGRVLSSRSRASIAVATFDHACKRPHSTVSTSSTSSNGSFQLAPHQPASMFDFRAIVEGDEYESGSGHGSSLCTSNGDADTAEGAIVTPDARPQQYVTTV